MLAALSSLAFLFFYIYIYTHMYNLFIYDKFYTVYFSTQARANPYRCNNTQFIRRPASQRQFQEYKG